MKILGDGQIWDVRGIDPDAPLKTFEDLFSGRALGEIAARKKVFYRFREKCGVTGLSVTKALLSNDPTAKKEARIAIEELAKNGARGIGLLSRGQAQKDGWGAAQKNYWKDIEAVIIGGGVSEEKTGRLLVSLINKYLAHDGLSRIKVYQARYPGKESGVLGAVINIIDIIGKKAAGIGIDLGRDEIGVGLVANNRRIFHSAVKTPFKRRLKKFLDRRRDYTPAERKEGRHIRQAILNSIAELVIKAETRSSRLGLACSESIAVAVPGAPGKNGAILNSTDYLPFFRQKDGFNFSRSLEALLLKKTLHKHRVYIINDGIAAGLANAYFGFSGGPRKKFSFLGVGSGLGGCVGIIN
ncbi:MAG: hypothetical protein PHG40_01135 [Candidatus Omnitrophica bacterium]|nr:hypothetical protein [Candidatus Omnitrophota bacterium]